MTPIQKTARVGTQEILLETGKIAKQAHGAVWVRMGDSIVLVTAVSSGEEGRHRLPSPSTYQEKLFAAGRPGQLLPARGAPDGEETLTSRIVDRSCRPLFAEGYANETQLIATVISFDQENDTDVLALTGASAALHLRRPVQRPDRRRPRRPRRTASSSRTRRSPQRGGGPRRHHGRLARRDRDGGGRREGGVRAGDGGRAPLRAGSGEDLLDAQDALRKATGDKPRRTFDPPKNDVELKRR